MAGGSQTYLPPQSVYPTASYSPVVEQAGGAGLLEGATVAGTSADPSMYIAPATYAPTVYINESAASSGAPAAYGGPPSYSPAPSASYMAQPIGSYQPPVSTSYIAGGQASYQPPPAYGGMPSYTPAVVENGMPVTYNQMVASSAMYGPAYSAQVVMPQQGQLAQSGSYVPAPGAPPPKLTEGMPDPSSVESQKNAYSKSIEAQLRQETGALAERNQKQKQSLAQMVQQQKAAYNLQMDQYLQQQAMAVDQQANAEMTMLQEAAMAQKMALEQQAAGLCLEFQQRKAQEEMMAREYQIQKQYYEAEQKLAATYQKQHGVEGRLSQQQLAMGHAAISSTAGAPVMQQPPINYVGQGAPMTTTMSVLQQPPMTFAAGPSLSMMQPGPSMYMQPGPSMYMQPSMQSMPAM